MPIIAFLFTNVTACLLEIRKKYILVYVTLRIILMVSLNRACFEHIPVLCFVVLVPSKTFQCHGYENTKSPSGRRSHARRDQNAH